MTYASFQAGKEQQISALYVDDEADLLILGKRFLERSGELVVTTCTSAPEALDLSARHRYDIIISDYQMPGMDGIAFLKEVRQKIGKIPFILFTGRGREEVVIEAINNGADFYLQKGGDPKPQFAELAHKVRQAVKKKHAEESIIESEKKLSDIIDFLPDATLALDQNGRVIAWNRALEEMTGVTSSEILGKDNYAHAIPFYGYHRPLLIDLIDEPDETIEQFYSILVRDSTTITAETGFTLPEGKQLTVLVKVCPLYNQNGERSGRIESIRDITPLKKIRTDLQESEIKCQNIIQNSQDCILIVAFDGTILFVNPNGLVMMDEWEGPGIAGRKNVMDYIHPESRSLVIRDMQQVAEGYDGSLSLYRLVTRKNREIWVESIGKKIPYQRSEVILVSLRDVTVQKRSEEALRESGEQFRALTEQSPDIILRVDKNLRILYCNPVIIQYTGFTPDQLIGKDWRVFSRHGDKIGIWVQSVMTVFETGTPSRGEYQVGSELWFDILYYPEFGEDGKVKVVTTSIRDITRKKQVEAEREIYYRDLLVQREFSEALLDAIPLPVQWKDTSGRFLGCNNAWSRFIGRKKEEIIGKTIGDIWQGKNEVTDVDLHDHEILEKGSLHTYQTKLTDGEERSHDVIISKNTFRDYSGNIAGVVAVLQDITDYKRLILDLKNREEFFRMILTQSSDFFIIVTPSFEISYISPGVEQVSGFLTEEILGPLARFVHPEDLGRVTAHLERLSLNQTTSERAEFRTLRRDGSFMLQEGEAINCIDNPAIRGILITARDITRKREIEQELIQRTELFTKIMDSAPAYFALFNKSGKILNTNRVFSERMGIHEVKPGVTSICDYLFPELGEQWEEIIARVVTDKSTSVQEFHFRENDSTTIISALFFPVQWRNEAHIGFIGLDITEKEYLVTTLDQIRIQNQVLENLVQERTKEVSHLLDLKDSLITGIAHELRTPLTPLTALIPLLATEENYSNRMEMIRILEKNTDRIARIVEQILHLANLGIMYTMEDVYEIHVRAAIEKLLHVYHMVIAEKGISTAIEIPENMILITSSSHFIAILENIISNAVKYSDQQGTILISAEDKGDEILLLVRDDGIGLTREDLMRVFEPFFKADPSRHDRLSPGLGLSVTKRFMEAIGGSISIKSDGPGTGTEVILRFGKRVHQ
jgi:PAS domain S-box-containing protein